jgi:predicted DCC family thiol-disulfide oxidoreductase YuxK
MMNGWTGGQYSLYRAIFGLYLSIHFVALLPWSAELFSNRGVLPADASPLLHLFPNVLAVSDTRAIVAALITLGAIAALFFLLGQYDRTAGVVIWYVLACLSGRNPLIANPSLPFVGWLLLAHAFVPASPYGSWSARGRTDPRGGWFMPPAVFAAAWIVMAIGYSYSGYTKLVSPSWVNGNAIARVLNNPLARPTLVRSFVLAGPDFVFRFATWGALALELTYVLLALSRRARPWIWAAMLAFHVGLMVLIDFADLSFGMVILHLFTFDPRWVPDLWSGRRDQFFYDGTCGLCHRGARFVLSEDRSGTAFSFGALQGETFAETTTREQRCALPDSIVVRTEHGELLVRSDAVVYILRRLGGMWRVIAAAISLAPRGLRNGIYDFIARIRHRVFGRAKTLCPVLPADLRSRFLR